MIRKIVFIGLVLIILAALTYHPTETSSPASQPANTIRIDGIVKNPTSIGYKELKEMPSTNVTAVLYCVDAPNVPRKNGTWKGVPLRYLLNISKPEAGAIKVAFYAKDGYTTDLPLKYVMENGNVIVAYEFNGKPIPPRLVVPDMWGYKWIRNLREIRLVSYNFLGTWEKVGYPDEAYVVNGRRIRR